MNHEHVDRTRRAEGHHGLLADALDGAWEAIALALET